ncbi:MULTISPECIES: serine/threonine-protein kinase [Corallococcus]|uniref:serine/threonine-protein kinase n=1 Tax=Corallococcus TaxID=83461 RepID=UPI001F3413C5|nr:MULTISPECIES: serine/threonine-protein kinase [Corallococcus]
MSARKGAGSHARVNGYTLQQRIAVGAMSEVYEAIQDGQGARVAIKLLRPEQSLHAEVVARFLNEARALMALQHPNLVRALEMGVIPDGPPFMVLEWLPTNLQEVLLHAGGRLPAGDCVRVVQQLARVLSHLHGQGLVHRDLKPANVLLARSEPGRMEVRLADLGFARRMTEASASTAVLAVSTAREARLGTWDFMAPEQWVDSKRVDGKADVYALGILWFQMLVGRLPFEARNEQGLMFQHLLEAPPVGLLEPRASPVTRGWVARLLEKNPAERPALEDLLGALASFPELQGP